MVRKLGIEPGEGRLFAWGAAALALAGWASVSVQNVSEAFFSKRVGVEYYPLAFLINSILLVGTTYAAGLLAARSNRPRLLPKVFVGLGILLIPLWFLVRADVISAFVLLVLASKQFQSIALLSYWLAMGDLMHGRQAKRLFAPMMAGYTLGAIVGSFASEPIGLAFGIDTLLPVAAVAFVGSGLLTLPLEGMIPKRLERGPASGSKPRRREQRAQPTFRELWRDSQLFRLLFVGAAASGLLGPMLYFQFQYVTDQATTGEAGLLALFAQFRGWINIGVLATQLAVTSSLFRRIGIPLSIVVSPLVYLIGFCGMSIRLSLTVGMGAFAGTKLQDSAIYDPAMRILFNLFPERERTRATGLLEGPVKRAGGAIGNVLSMGAIQVASAVAVGYVAIPIAAAWLVSSVALWRTYPGLLLRASAKRARDGDDLDIAELIDPNTVRVLSNHLAGPAPGPAVELISEARTEVAAAALASAARAASDATRSTLIAALDRLLGRSVTEAVTNRAAAADLEALLLEQPALSDRDRAEVVQAYGRLSADGGDDAVLRAALANSSAAVRLAAGAALRRRHVADDPAGDFTDELERSIASSDPVERCVALEELRTDLLSTEPGPQWERQLALLARLLERASDRADAAEALAWIARRHGAAAAVVGESMLSHRDTEEPRVRAALLRFCGSVGLTDQAAWLVEHVAIDGGGQLEAVRNAAREGLIALGPEAADVLLVELSYGKRSTRDAILPIIRQLQVEEETLRDLFERELVSIRRKLIHRLALSREVAASIVVQLLRERTQEGLHTALLLLAAIHNEDRIAELGAMIKLGGSEGSNAILFEALDALLYPQEKSKLMPLMGDRPLELRARSAASALGVPVPDVEQAALALLQESDELTRILTAQTLSQLPAVLNELATPEDVQDHGSMLSRVEIALHLKSLPLFDGLMIRQLMELADEVHEEVHAAGTTVFREGDFGDCLYLIVEGRIRVTTGDTLLSELGPKNFFGEIAVLEAERRTATISATTSVRLLRLDRNDLLRLMEELPAIAICICQTLSKNVSELTRKVSDLSIPALPTSTT